MTVSPLSADRQADLVAQLRRSDLRQVGELSEASNEALYEHIETFVGSTDLLIIIGWDIDEEPAVLIPAEAVTRNLVQLRSLHPNGFVMFDQPATAALIIDFDEDRTSANYVERVAFAETIDITCSRSPES